MKRLLCLFLALAMILMGCGKPVQPTSEPATPTDASISETTPTDATKPETIPSDQTDPETLAYLRENLPVMDGSTSLIPLEAGIRAAIFDKSIEEATADVAHSSTWSSFYNLMEGKADLVFSCPLSRDQYLIAKDSGFELELVPVAMEGFVFVVNADNPIDKLTQQQIKDIYSGKITNWAQLGGLNQEIIPYQRNTESGSQNYMIEFMGDTPLMDAPIELRPASMSGLMDVIAINDNALGAIGYSVYAYAADMYGNGDEIKFIQVDGVAPSKTTFASGEYPLLGKNYAVFSADEPDDGPVRRLVDWMLTTTGQTAIAKAGYVTVRDIGFDYEEMTLKTYQGSGTGPEAEMTSYEYVLREVEHFEYGDSLLNYLTPEPVWLSDGTISYHLTQLSDPALQAEINDFIDEQVRALTPVYPEMERYVEKLNGNYYSDLYACRPDWITANYWQEGTPACYINCKNGYLYVLVSLSYTYQVMEGKTYYYLAESATWDLISGTRLSTEDLFCKGVDIDAVLNTYLRRASLEPTDGFGSYYEMKQDFVSLPSSGWTITPEAIYFEQDNPYFAEGACFSLHQLPAGTLVTETPREFAHCFRDPDVVQVKRFRTDRQDFYYAYNTDSLIQCAYLNEDAHPNARRINQEVQLYLDTYFTEEAIRSYYRGIGLDENNVELFMLDWWLINYGDKFLVFQGSSPNYYIPEEDRFEIYPIGACLVYELDTGRQIGWQELFTEGWQSAAQARDEMSDEPIEIADYRNFTLKWMNQDDDGSWFLSITDGTISCYLEVPQEYNRY